MARIRERTRAGAASSLAVWALLLAPDALLSQERPWVRWGAHAVLAYIAADPVPGGGRLDELRVLHPVVGVEAGAFRRLGFLATLNLEGATIPGGELSPGAWGEGFVDRRHPHTYVHEALLSAGDVLGGLDGATEVSLTAGKGFAPFGTDDPMLRPPLRYPVNHHLAQILERAVAILAARSGPVVIEAGLFNGDEPERPGQWPKVRRFGDSWSVRLTATPSPWLELQGSHADVRSPEHRGGAGTEQSKWSLSGRVAGVVAGAPAVGLVEWARTSEAGGFFVFSSLLAEGAWQRGRHRLLYRFERATRPEEERVSAFRSRRPHLENAILGTTRWTIHTVGYDVALGSPAGIRLRPLAELSAGTIRRVGGGLFDPEELYGGDAFWSLSLGLRLGLGSPMPRMGRYGAARIPTTSHHLH